MTLKSIPKYLLLFALVYPVALVIRIAFDTYAGDMVFFDRWLYDSKTRLAQDMLADWVNASLLVVPVMLISYTLQWVGARIGRVFILLCALAAAFVPFVVSEIPQLLGVVIAFALAAPLLAGKGAAR